MHRAERDASLKDFWHGRSAAGNRYHKQASPVASRLRIFCLGGVSDWGPMAGSCDTHMQRLPLSSSRTLQSSLHVIVAVEGAPTLQML